VPIIYVCDAHDVNDKEFLRWPTHCIKNTKGAAVVNELAPEENDFIVKKTTYEDFYDTGLEKF